MLSVVNLLTIKLQGFDRTMLKSNFWLLIFGCPPDNQIIILGCPAHVLVVSGERTTVISNAEKHPISFVSAFVFSWLYVHVGASLNCQLF